MTSAADSVARHAPRGESDRVPHAEAEHDRVEGAPGASPHLPVFAAFDELGLTGRDVAEFSAVSAPTLSKWRSAKARLPGKRLAFLTLVLAHLLDEIQVHADLAQADLEVSWETQPGETQPGNAGRVNRRDNVRGAGTWVRGDGTWGARIQAAKAYLAYQDVLNQSLSARDVRDGGRLFRIWWTSSAARRLWEKRFKPESTGS